MSQQRVHLICNAHLDPVWQWEWDEGAAAAVSTFRTAADLCEEFDGFVFNHNEAILYQWIEEYEPDLFLRIKRLVQNGKWHVMGGWYLQPDCNMPSGESLVRQILVGRRYFQERLGASPTTAINFDPFGHTRGLPQILARSGYDSYLFCRPGQADCPLPADTFRWVGFDGSSVNATRASGFYNSPLGGARGKVEAWLAAHPDEAVTLVLWGVGNHGGGPSRRDLRDLAEFLRERDGARHSTPERYFADVREHCGELPCHAADLNAWAVGCYTSQVRIKQRHRRLECALLSTEKMAAAAALQGLLAYPRADLAEAQRDLLLSQFHDVLPGSSVQPVEEMSLRVLDHGLEILSRIRTRAFFALASGQRPAAEGETPVLVYNPHPTAMDTDVECEFMLEDQNWEPTYTHVTVWQDGRQVPSQVEKEESNLNLDWRKRVVLRARLEPGCMSRFDCRLERLPARAVPSLPEEDGCLVLRSAELDAAVSLETGLLHRCVMRGSAALGPEAIRPLVMEDNEDPWGMTVNAFRTVIGAFRLMTPEEAAAFAGVRGTALAPVRVIEDGPVRAVVEALLAYGHSAICQRYVLPRTGSEVGIETRAHWNEKDRALKLHLPLPAGQWRYVGQTAYGTADLPGDGREAVAQRWVAAVDDLGDRAVTILNDGIYGSDLSSEGVRLTLLRSPAYAGHPIGDRPIVPQDRYTPRIDQGERLFRFRLNAGRRATRLAAVDGEAALFSEAPYALSFFPSGAGTVPRGFVTLSDPTVQLTAAKLAEDGDDLVLRLFEPTGSARTVTVDLPFAGMQHELNIGGSNVRTLRVNIASRSFVETDLMERPL